jgi:hypothetical protein
VANDAGAVASALDRRIDGQERDVWMQFVTRKLATFTANIEGAEPNQAAVRINIAPVKDVAVSATF